MKQPKATLSAMSSFSSMRCLPRLSIGFCSTYEVIALRLEISFPALQLDTTVNQLGYKQVDIIQLHQINNE